MRPAAPMRPVAPMRPASPMFVDTRLKCLGADCNSLPAAKKWLQTFRLKVVSYCITEVHVDHLARPDWLDRSTVGHDQTIVLVVWTRFVVAIGMDGAKLFQLLKQIQTN